MPAGWMPEGHAGPLCGGLSPLMIDREAELRARAPDLWRTVQTGGVKVVVASGGYGL